MAAQATPYMIPLIAELEIMQHLFKIRCRRTRCQVNDQSSGAALPLVADRTSLPCCVNSCGEWCLLRLKGWESDTRSSH